jgi:hypothetical protein
MSSTRENSSGLICITGVVSVSAALFTSTCGRPQPAFRWASGLEVGLVQHIQGQALRGRAAGVQRLGGGLGARRVHVGQQHAVAGAVQLAGDHLAQTGGRAGDDRNGLGRRLGRHVRHDEAAFRRCSRPR